MENKRWLAWIIIGILFVVFGVTSYLAVFSDREEEKKKISVIIGESMDERWVIVKEGMEQAASDFGVALNIVLTDRISDPDEQQELLLREIAGGANGIIVEPVAGTGWSEFMSEHQGNVAITLVGSDFVPENVYDCVAPDSYEMGRQLGSALLADSKLGDDNLRIGMLASATPNFAAEQCLKGFLEIIPGDNIIWRMDPDSRLDSDIIRETNLNDINVLVAFESRMTEKMIDISVNGNFDQFPKLYGTGYSEKAIYYLDKGIVTRLVMTNEFNLGYLAVESAATKQSPEGLKYPKFDIYLVDQDNLYDDAFQKILFPLVQ